MNKHYTLIVSNHYSLSNETDSDAMTDYFPGIWAIKTQKAALKYAQEILAEGNTITVNCYDNSAYFGTANKFITALGLKQPLFNEPSTLKPVTSLPKPGEPTNLSQLKKLLTVGTKVRITNYKSDGTVHGERDTFVKRVQSNSFIFDKNGSDSWLEHGKASDWQFEAGAALKYYTYRDGPQLSSRIEYITN